MVAFNMMDEVSPLANVATFILKLWKMLQNKESLDIMCWNVNGKSFIILDQVAFITKLLPLYFKHNNMGSFVRQLNLYDFHKIGLDNKNMELEYQHKYFQQNRPDLLKFIKRKLPQCHRKIVCSQVDAKEFSSLNKEVAGIKNKQEEMGKQLDTLQTENLGLLKELGSLHAKQNSQTQVLKRIIELLIPFVDTYSSAQNTRTDNPGINNMIDQDGSSAKIFAINNLPSYLGSCTNTSNELMDTTASVSDLVSMTDKNDDNVTDGFLDLKDVIGTFNQQQLMMVDKAISSSVSPGSSKNENVPSTSYVVEEIDDANDKDTLKYLENTFSNLIENDILNYKHNVADDSSSND